MTTAASALLAPWAAVISEQMKRMKRGSTPLASTPLASTQLASGALLVLVLIFPIMLWQTAAYRSDRLTRGRAHSCSSRYP